MDNTTIVTIIIACIAIIPAIYALINQIKKDEINKRFFEANVLNTATQSYVERLGYRISKAEENLNMAGLKLSELSEIANIQGDDLMLLTDVSAGVSKKIPISGMVSKLWKMMYVQPVIVRCGNCGSHNVITNSNCIQCGAPGGNFKEIKNENFEKSRSNS